MEVNKLRVLASALMLVLVLASVVGCNKAMLPVPETAQSPLETAHVEQPVYVEKEQEFIKVGDSGISLVLPDNWKGKYGVEQDGDHIRVYHLATRERYPTSEIGILFAVSFTEEIRPMDYIWPWPAHTIAITETGTYLFGYPSDVQFDQTDPVSMAEYKELSDDTKNIEIIMTAEMLNNSLNKSNWVQGTMFVDFLENNGRVAKSVICNADQSQIIKKIIKSQDYGAPGSFHIDLRFMVDMDEYFMNSATGEIMIAAGGNRAVMSAEDLSKIVDLLSD